MILVDQVVTIKTGFNSLFKSNSSTVDFSINLDSSFVAEKKLMYLMFFYVFRCEILIFFSLSLVCTRVDSLARRSERLRSDFINLKRSVIDDFDKLGSRVSLLHGNIRQDPSIADFPLRNPWERISFLKSSFSETVGKMLPVLKIMNQPLLLQQV